MVLHTAKSMSNEEFSACFNLIESNMKPMYLRSTIGWSAPEKKKEMAHPAMRFLLLPEEQGFASFMVTEEEGEEVIYWFVSTSFFYSQSPTSFLIPHHPVEMQNEQLIHREEEVNGVDWEFQMSADKYQL